jgi:hypothetical protein
LVWSHIPRWTKSQPDWDSDEDVCVMMAGGTRLTPLWLHRLGSD